MNFRNQCPWRHNCGLYNYHVKITSYHVMYDRSSWFLRVIVSISHALCVACRQWRSKTMTSGLLRWPSKTSKNSWRQGLTKHEKIDEGGKGAVCWLPEREKTERTRGKERVWKHFMSRRERKMVRLTPWGVWKPSDLARTDIFNQQEGLILLMTSSSMRLTKFLQLSVSN